MSELDIADFVRAERALGEDDAAEQADVLARLELTLGLLPPGGGGAGGEGGPAPGGQTPSPTGSAGGAARKVLTASALAKAGGLLVVGFLAGAAVHAGLTRPPEPARVAVAATAAREPALAAAPPASASPSVAELSAVAPSALPDAPPPATSVARDDRGRSDLDAERTLLETARTALVRGDSEHALAALDRHRARFPAGQLREERESLNVYALVAANRRDEARAKAAEFRRSFPRSLQGAALDGLVGAP